MVLVGRILDLDLNLGSRSLEFRWLEFNKTGSQGAKPLPHFDTDVDCGTFLIDSNSYLRNRRDCIDHSSHYYA
ncbi:hypothetical protein PCCS19_32460 [Paenibacillus sp. CCS19]|nr:hypothetical protein PCCS19_32460 [Paenibacillus cellulosilyticus]